MEVGVGVLWKGQTGAVDCNPGCATSIGDWRGVAHALGVHAGCECVGGYLVDGDLFRHCGEGGGGAGGGEAFHFCCEWCCGVVWEFGVLDVNCCRVGEIDDLWEVLPRCFCLHGRKRALFLRAEVRKIRYRRLADDRAFNG